MSRLAKIISAKPGNVIARLALVLEAFDELVDSIDELGLVVDDIKQTLASLAEENPELGALLQQAAHVRPPSTRNRNSGARFVESANLLWSQDRAVVLVDGQRVELSLRLGMLFEILLADGESSQGWKTRLTIRQLLEKRTGAAMSQHALENLLSRLRIELGRQAHAAGLVQSSRQRGLRLALRKYQTDSTPDGS